MTTVSRFGVVHDTRSTRHVAATASGKLVAALGVVCVVAAVLTRWTEPAVVAVGCCAALLVDLPSLLRTSYLQISRSIAKPFVPVGDPVMIRLTVTNPSDQMSRAETIHQSFGRAPVASDIPGIAPDTTWVGSSQGIPTSSRGIFELSAARRIHSGLFGLLGGPVTVTEPQEIVVHPRIRPLSVTAGGWAKDLEGPSFDNSPTGGFTFHATRPYEIGDDVRHIHWLTTARTGEPMVRQYVDSRIPSVYLHVDDLAASYAVREDFEIALECAASVATAFLRARGSLTLALGASAPYDVSGADSISAVLKILANASLRPSGPSSHEQTLSGRAAIRVLVTGTADPKNTSRLVRTAPFSAGGTAVLAGRSGHDAVRLPTDFDAMFADSLDRFVDLWEAAA